MAALLIGAFYEYGALQQHCTYDAKQINELHAEILKLHNSEASLKDENADLTKSLEQLTSAADNSYAQNAALNDELRAAQNALSARDKVSMAKISELTKQLQAAEASARQPSTNSSTQTAVTASYLSSSGGSHPETIADPAPSKIPPSATSSDFNPSATNVPVK